MTTTPTRRAKKPRWPPRRGFPFGGRVAYSSSPNSIPDACFSALFKCSTALSAACWFSNCSSTYCFGSSGCHIRTTGRSALTRAFIAMIAPILFRLRSMAVGSVGNPNPSYWSVSNQHVRVRPVMRPSSDGVGVCTSYRLCKSGRFCFLARASAGGTNSKATIAAAIMVLRFFVTSFFTASQ